MKFFAIRHTFTNGDVLYGAAMHASLKVAKEHHAKQTFDNDGHEETAHTDIAQEKDLDQIPNLTRAGRKQLKRMLTELHEHHAAATEAKEHMERAMRALKSIFAKELKSPIFNSKLDRAKEHFAALMGEHKSVQRPAIFEYNVAKN